MNPGLEVKGGVGALVPATTVETVDQVGKLESRFENAGTEIERLSTFVEGLTMPASRRTPKNSLMPISAGPVLEDTYSRSSAHTLSR